MLDEIGSTSSKNLHTTKYRSYWHGISPDGETFGLLMLSERSLDIYAFLLLEEMKSVKPIVGGLAMGPRVFVRREMGIYFTPTVTGKNASLSNWKLIGFCTEATDQ